jgi:PhzF family phenazine biosynthesis protein
MLRVSHGENVCHEPSAIESGGALLRRISAFTTTADGGNPAGVWIGDELPTVDEMQQVAREVGYSETAFLAPSRGHERTIRYYSPEAEVSFCGHATVAAGVVLGEREGVGTYQLRTSVGDVPVTASLGAAGLEASLVSVEPRHEPPEAGLLARVLDALRWAPADLDPSIPPARAFAGAWHLVIAVSSRERLARLDYDFDELRTLMERENLTTLQLVWREGTTTFHSRNPFPVGGVVEDPATGAAAAALGGYLRDAGLVDAPAELVIIQGVDMGRPSELTVAIPAKGGITVRGAAVDLEAGR